MKKALILFEMEEEEEKDFTVYDARFHHPFTCIVNGPSGSGKTTFIKDLLLDPNMITVELDHIFCFLGTPIEQNKQFLSLKEAKPNIVKSMHVQETYGDNLKKSNFQKDLEKVLKDNNNRGETSCVIFDDLMTEMSDTNIIADMFSKVSTHSNTSVINITQNLFHKGKGSSGVSVYRNAKILVLFESRNDCSIFRNLAQKFATPSQPFRKLFDFFNDVTRKHRYIVCRGNFQTPEEIKYTTGYTSSSPVRHIKVVQPLVKTC